MNTISLDKIIALCAVYDTERATEFAVYNTMGGKSVRRRLFNLMLQDLGHEDSEVIIGDLIELYHAVLLVIDDVMDNSDTRRGQVCYFRKRGMISLRYAKAFYSIISSVLPSEGAWIFRENWFATCVGQTIDAKPKVRSEYTLSLYEKIADLKTARYTFNFPLQIAYLMSKKIMPKEVLDLSFYSGLVFQMQDDYLNFFPERSGKSGKDLEEKKCTYFLQLLSKENNEDVITYFETGEVRPVIMEYIKEYFKVYKKDLGEKAAVLKELLAQVGGKASDYIRELQERQT